MSIAIINHIRKRKEKISNIFFISKKLDIDKITAEHTDKAITNKLLTVAFSWILVFFIKI
jgi:hypothetical protein